VIGPGPSNRFRVQGGGRTHGEYRPGLVYDEMAIIPDSTTVVVETQPRRETFRAMEARRLSDLRRRAGRAPARERARAP
jgi:hypothetical protein